MDDKLDAERYRWLNNQHHFMVYIEGINGQQEKVLLRCGPPLDEWIDNRIKEEKSRPHSTRTDK